MPDFAMASSKPMVMLAGTCASREEDTSTRMNIRDFKSMSSRSISGIAGQVSRSGGFQQNRRNGVLRGRFWAGMAADAATLLASPHPEESRLPLQGFACGI